MTIRAKVMTITPEIATRWLERAKANEDPNRNVSQATVEKYAADIRAGKWRLTGDTIKFNVNDELIDGQHRLWAVVESGRSIEALVVHGAPEDAIHSVDVGKPRSVPQVLKIIGVESINHNRLVAVTRMVVMTTNRSRPAVQLPATGKLPGQRTLSVDEAQAAISRSPGIAWIMTQPGANAGTPYSRASVLAGFAIVYAKDRDLASSGWDALMTGADLKRGDPILALRNFLASSGGTIANGTVGGRAAITRRVLTALAYRKLGKELQRSVDGYDGMRHFVPRAAKAAEKAAAEARETLTLV